MLENPYLLYASAGAGAGLIRDIMRTGGLVLMRKEKMQDGTCILRLGFLAAMILGAAAGVAADHHWITSALAGWAGPDFLESFVNAKSAKNRKRVMGSGMACPPEQPPAPGE